MPKNLDGLSPDSTVLTWMTTAICPPPTPSPIVAAIASASDPWAWSLSDVLALIGLVVAGLGATATVLVAWFALRATQRANRLEAEARERAGRAALTSSVDVYLSGWELDPYYFGDSVKGRESARALIASAAGISTQAATTAAWVRTALAEMGEQHVDEHRELDNVTGRALLTMAARGASSEVRRRMTVWVATGTLDDSPLLTPIPVPPPLNFS